MSSRIYVSGADTFIGRAIARCASQRSFGELIVAREPDLTDRRAVDAFFKLHRPDVVFATGGRTAGIGGNVRAPADLMLNNLLTSTNVISSAFDAGVKRLQYLASSCIYPPSAAQPFKIDSLWSGALEPSSNAYATAKLAGIRLCDAYRRQHGVMFTSAVTADAYGPFDDFTPENSHVVAALLGRIHEATTVARTDVEVWGSGMPQREFIYVDDLADACLFAFERYEGAEPINLGTGSTTSIRELAETIRDVVGYRGGLTLDARKPDGMPFKGLDSSVLHGMGWRPQIDLPIGLRLTYEWFQSFC